jgi:uncharacterized membrane protein YfcA
VDLVFVSLASFLAGLVDSIVGGGGLILVPALFTTFPNAPPATLLGTNKSASVWGTSIAAVQYSRRVQIDWAVLLPAAATALLGACVGAWAVTQLDGGFLRKLLPFILVAVLVYTLVKKDLGEVHAPRHSPRTAVAIACSIGGLIGWYDGFFGPGTGSFFIFLLVRFLGYDFLNASASAKLLNVATTWPRWPCLRPRATSWWHIGLVMAVANVAGSVLGSRLALKHGAIFVRRVFVVVVSLLILKTGRDAFWP